MKSLKAIGYTLLFTGFIWACCATVFYYMGIANRLDTQKDLVMDTLYTDTLRDYNSRFGIDTNETTMIQFRDITKPGWTIHLTIFKEDLKKICKCDSTK